MESLKVFALTFLLAFLSQNCKYNNAKKFVVIISNPRPLCLYDIVVCNNFREILESYIKELPSDWEMLFIGNGCGLHIDKNLLIPEKHIYKKNNGNNGKKHKGATRCLDSYLISNKCAKIITEKLKLPNYTILAPVDLWMNCVIRNNNFNVYWAEPTIVTQGSNKGIFKSTLR